MDYSKSSRMFSLLGQKGTFGTVLDGLAKENKRIYAISCDLTHTSGLERFSTDHPERFLNAGIAEENAVGLAAGLADQGYIPFVTTFSNFATLRANEFVRHFMAYMNCNVKLIGLGSGFAMELFGTTHYGLEDIATIRSMPNIQILSPADGIEVARCVEYAAQHDGPVYIRLSGRANNPIVYNKDYDFVPGKAIKLREGSDVVIYATGSMVSVAMRVATELAKRNIEISVYDVHTIKPIDQETISRNKDVKLILTAEEHAAVGGLGSAVAEVLSGYSTHGKLIRMGTVDRYLKAGTYEYMLEQHGLAVSIIVNKIKSEIGGTR